MAAETALATRGVGLEAVVLVVVLAMVMEVVLAMVLLVEELRVALEAVVTVLATAMAMAVVLAMVLLVEELRVALVAKAEAAKVVLMARVEARVAPKERGVRAMAVTMAVSGEEMAAAAVRLSERCTDSTRRRASVIRRHSLQDWTAAPHYREHPQGRRRRLARSS